MTNTLRRLSWLLICLSLLYACTEDYFEFDKIKTTEWRPEFAIPLANSSLTLNDILANEDTAGLISIGNNGILQILYRGNVISKIGGERIRLEDQNNQFTVSGIVVPPGNSITVPYNTTINYTPNGGVEIDSVNLKDGDFVVTVESDFQHPVDIVANYPGFKDASGNSLQLNFQIPASNGITPSVRSRVVDLTGYSIDMTNGGTTSNSIAVVMQITISPISGNPSSTSDELRFNSSIRNIDFREFFGYAGQEPLELEKDTILIALFKNFDQGMFYLADPTLDIVISNSYGMPISFNFNYLNALTPNYSPAIQPINLGGNNPLLLNSPAPKGIAFTNLQLNSDNSNIDTLISRLLKEIAYEAVGNPNPAGNSGPRNYISDTSAIGLDVSLNLPFVGFANGMVMQDTIDFEFENADGLESGLIRTRVENGFPIQGELQLIFTDENYVPLDSLYPNGQEVTIPAAPVGMNGFSSGKANSVKDTEIKNERLKKLVDSKFAILRAELQTTNGNQAAPDTVKFLPEYKLDISIGIKATILID